MSIYYKLSHERNMELIRLYESTLNEWKKAGRKITRKEIITHILLNGKPRYSVGYEYALRKIRQIKNHGGSNLKMTQKQTMWHEINDKMHLLMARRPRLKDTEALADILAFDRASQFFFTYAYARRIIYDWENSRDCNIRA